MNKNYIVESERKSKMLEIFDDGEFSTIHEAINHAKLEFSRLSKHDKERAAYRVIDKENDYIFEISIDGELYY